MTDDTALTSHAEQAPASRLRDLPRAVWALTAARAVNRLGAFSLPFLGVVLTVELNAPVTTAGWLLAAFGLATIPSRLAGGALADRFGRTTTICIGLVGTAMAQLWLALSHSVWAAGLAVVALGLFFELYEPPSQAIIADLTDARSRPVAYGLLASAMAGAGVAAGLLAAWLGGIDLRWLLVVDAATCLVCAATVWLVVRVNLHERTGPSPLGAIGPWQDRRLLLMLGSGTVFALLYLQLTMSLPLTLPARGLPAPHAGVLFTVSAVTIIVGQPLLRRGPLRGLDGFRAMTVGYAVLAAGLAGTAAATTLPGFIAATVLWSVGDLILLGHAWSIVAELAPVEARARYLAAFGLSWGIAAVLAPVLGTHLLDRGGPTLLWLTCAALASALAAAQPALGRYCSRPRP